MLSVVMLSVVAPSWFQLLHKRVKMTGWPDITTVFTIKITVGGGVPYHDSDHKDLNLNSVIDVLK